MTPEDFITIIASPNVEAALAAPNDHRSIFAVAASIESLSSQLYYLCKDAGGSVPAREGHFKRDVLEPLSDAFRIMHAVAETQKHSRLSDPNRPVIRLEAITSREHGWDTSPWGEFMWDVGEAIAIELDGQLRTIAPIAAAALSFLSKELAAARARVAPSSTVAP